MEAGKCAVLRSKGSKLCVSDGKELGPNVVHFRIALTDEPGIELIPGSHRRWDNDDELDVRPKRNGRKNYENLSAGKAVKLDAGAFKSAIEIKANNNAIHPTKPLKRHISF